MARLNDPPPAAESVDALKRRFVRQNRELARINSNQSVRIRNLENEISRLLSENIALRERLIKLQHEIDKSPGQAAFDSVGMLRNNLEAKVAELSNILKELGNVQIEPRRVSRRRSVQQTSPKRSPDQKIWKNALTLSEVTGVMDGRLPPIAEDKSYPRRTLESDELQGMLDAADALDSPDLGPPPVASWEEVEPIKKDSVLSSPTQQLRNEATDSIHLRNLANFETRKKRRETTNRLEAKATELSDMPVLQPAAPSDVSAQPFKTGAKRKLNVRDDDESTETRKALENNGFSSDRKIGTSSDLKNKAASEVFEKFDRMKISQDRVSKTSEYPGKTKEDTLTSSTKPRKALGAKSVNTDPVRSPAKLSTAPAGGKRIDPKERAQSRSKDRHRSAERPPTRKHETQLNEDEPLTRLRPNSDFAPSQVETPIAPPFDISPPLSSTSLAVQQESRDTPPPADLVSKVSDADMFGTVGRASRRARGSVSYAEPSLRDKMRRPTKELVDAVGADERPQVIRVEEVNAGPQSEKSNMRTVVVKKETSGEQVDWRDLPLANHGENHHKSINTEPTSPLSNKSAAASTKDLPATVVTDRGGRDSFPSCSEEHHEQYKPASASGSTIATLVAGTQKGRNRDIEPACKAAKGSKDIFELNSSSPADAVASTTTAPTRTSRRYSTIASDPEPKISSAGTRSSVVKRHERRRESVMSVPSGKDREGAGTTSTQDTGGIAVAGTGRAERTASRRRSMML